MNARGENVDERTVGGDGPVRRTRIVGLLAGSVALVAVLLGVAAAPAAAVSATAAAPSSAAVLPASAAVAPASAAGPASAAATPDPTSTPVPQNQLTPRPGAPTASPARPVRPTIADPGDITSATVRFSGTGTPGHELRVSGQGATGSTGSAGCSATVRGDGAWSCLAAVRSGPQQVFTVRDVSAPGLGSATTPTSDVIVPPVVTTSRPTSGPVSGTGRPGSTVSVAVSGSTAERTTTVGRDGRWTVSLGGSSSSAGKDARLTVTATQTASTAGGYRSDLRSAASAPVTITLDRTAPAAPRISSPSAGDRFRAQPVTVSGTGEPGAVLTVYVDRAPVCRADVAASGRWSCSTAGSTLRPGARALTAAQQDAAGNFSATSSPVRVTVATGADTGDGSSATPGGAGSGPDGSGGAGTGAGTGGSTGGGTGTGTNGGDHSGNGGSGAGSGTGHGHGHGTGTDGGGYGTGHGTDGVSGAAGSGSGGSGTAGGGTTGTGTLPGTGPGRGLDWSGPAGDWTASTSYDTTVPTIQSAFSWRTVLVATAVAAGFLVLVAGPLALVAGAARGRLRSPFAGLLGRNRPHDERRRGDVLPTWASITVAVLVVGLCTILGVGVSLEARYVRLAVAVLLGAAVLATTVVLASRWAAGPDRRTVGFRVSPWLVLAALVACAVTRSFDLSPALVVGAVLVPVGRPDAGTATLRLGSSIVAGARSATWRSVALLVVAAVGWVLHSVTPGSGFWVSFVSEFAITLCLGGLGAVVTTLLPVAGSAGQTLFAQSRGRYVAIAAVAVALAAAVSSGAAGTHVSPVALVVVAGACTAGAAASWLWQRNTRADQRA
jgi:hypothetical protein